MNALEVRTIEGWLIASGLLRGLGLQRQVDVTPLSRQWQRGHKNDEQHAHTSMNGVTFIDLVSHPDDNQH
jgi:hypothetical protein